MTNDPFALDDNPLYNDDLGDFGSPADSGPPAATGKRGSRGGRATLLIAAASLVVAVVALLISEAAGWATVLVGSVAYLLAAATDLRHRQQLHSRRNYQRPWGTLLLRVAVFCVAAVAAWQATEGLAS